MPRQDGKITAKPVRAISAPDVDGSSGADRLFLGLRWVLCGLVVLYVAGRALTLALTGDEWGLILDDVQQSFVHLLVQGHIDVQSTFLLVCLAKIIALFTPNLIFAVRLPSVLAVGLYLWAAWHITAPLRPRWLSGLALLALCAHAYLLDFFSIGRGYGLALAFQMLSLYLFFRALVAARNRGKYLYWCVGAVWAASFSVLSIVAFLNYYFAIWACCFLVIYWYGRSQDRIFSPATIQAGIRNSLHLVYNAALLGIFYLPRVLILNMNHCFSAGGSAGFVQSTVQSLVQVHFYLRPPPDQWLFFLALLVWIASLLVSFFLASRYAKTGKEPMTAAGIYVSLMLAIMATFHFLLFHITGTLYPVMRAALCFFPLFVLQIACFAAIPHWATRILGSAILVGAVLIGASGANLRRTQTYNCSAQHPAVIDDLAAIHQATGQPIVLGVWDRLKYTLWWYAEHRLGLAQEPNPEGIHDGLMRRYGWLTIYTLHYGGYRLYAEDTTHVLLDLEESSPNDIPRKLTPINDYPTADIRLYKVDSAPQTNNAVSHSFLSVIGRL